MLSSVWILALFLTLLSIVLSQETLSCPRDSATGSIRTGGGLVIYRLVVPDNDQTVVIDTCSTATTFDTVLELSPSSADFSASRRIARNDDSTTGSCRSQRSRIEAGLANSGNYYIRVSGFSSTTTGSFVLQVSCRDQSDIIIGSGSGSSLDTAGAATLGGVLILYIVLGTVLPCVVICICICVCVSYSNKRSTTTVVMPRPVAQQGAVVMQTYPQVVQPAPMQAAPTASSFYPAVQPASTAVSIEPVQQHTAVSVQPVPTTPMSVTPMSAPPMPSAPSDPSAPPPPYTDDLK